ncbi:Diphthamide synthase [Hirschfeldia incana]|nr:Diphthamide synthase [Hirschfeldia incana]
MKVVALVSGGKDSCYVMMKCIQYGHEIVALANLLPVDDSVDELDSYMYQTVGHQIIVSYAECMNVPLFRRRIRGSSRHQKLSYQKTPDDEVEDLFVLLSEVKRQIPSITAVSSGAIASDYQRLRVESICSRLGLVSLAFLWKQDQTLLLQEMIANGIKAILVKVAAIGLDPSKHLGKDLAFMEPYFLKLKELYGSNVCGEGGEYETLTLDCPLFTNARIVLDEFQVVLHSPDSIAPVGVLHPTTFHLEKKGNPDSDSLEEKEPVLVFEVQGDGGPNTPESTHQPDNGTVEHTRNRVSLSKTGKENTFSICCWLEDSSESSTGLKEDLETVLTEIESQLLKQGFNWQNVLYIHLYISDMSEFAVANETYVKFITHEKCPFGVPSRSTIELPLVQAGLGKAYVEVLVANDQTKRVLHVQSISSWAPSCIGPYSQATLHKGVLHMAGQLGLDPPTMNLRNEGAVAELKQALTNSEAIAEAFRCSISSSAILFVVFCSARVEQSERHQLHEKFVSFLDLAKSSRTRVSNVLDPIFLYILVPDLPKRALVEVKPVLYVQEDSETDDDETRQDQLAEGDYSCLGYKPEKWHQDCVQKRVVDGKLCVTVLSISAEVMKKLHESSGEEQLERVTRFCVYLLNKTLSENSFTWQDTTSLRIHFSTSLGVSVKRLSNIFETAFKKLNEMSHGGRVGDLKEPIFNLVPVLAAGNSSGSLDNIITCELFSLRS